ncbi:MAG: sugar ABC transporter permease, partial [Bacilli bacterium]|nr:sugar ABC transporter permease [Bacilli bacterium]
MSEEIKDLKDEEVAESKKDLNLDAIKTSDEASESANVSSAGEMTVKENWFAAKLRKFREWKTETGIKIDHWSRKKPFRRKLYLNRTLYLMMLPYMVGFTLFTILPVIISLYLSFTSF